MSNRERESRSTASGRVLDAATRYRRQKKALEALEQDNFHEEPHADLGKSLMNDAVHLLTIRSDIK